MASSRSIRSLLRRTVASSTALAVLAAALLVTMTETERLVSRVLGGGGHTHDLGSIVGIGAGTEVDAWGDWGAAAFSPGSLIVFYAVTDLAFIACYLVLLRRLVMGAISAANTRRPDAAPPHTPTAGLRMVGTLVALDIIEDAALIVLAAALPTAATPGLATVTAVLVVATYLKLATTAVLALYLVLGTVVGAAVRRAIARSLAALYAQRLSLIAVLGIAAVSLVGVDGVLEQVSDVYRGWVQYPASGMSALPLLDGWAIAFAFLAFLITGAGLFVLGRQRARHYRRRTATDDERPAVLHYPWLATAGGVLLVALVVGLATGGEAVDPLTVGLFVGAIAAMALVSLVIRRSRLVIGDPLLPLALDRRGADVKLAGDLLVAAWIGVWALSPFKALLAPLLLAATGQFEGSRFASSLPSILIIEVALLALAILVPVLFRGRFASHDFGGRVGAVLSSDPNRIAEHSRVFRVLGIVVVAVSSAFVVTCLLVPTLVGQALGPVAVLVLLAGAWTTLLGALVLALGRRQPLELFRVLRMRSTPVITLLVLLPVAVTFIDGAPALHAARVSHEATTVERDTLPQAFAAWHDAQQCSLELPGGERAYPLLLVATHGGGIRAATWTVDVMRELPRDGDCAAGATLLSSGASGGSVGLATFREEGNALDAASMDTVALGGPGALGVSVTGMMAGDLVGSLTGIRVPSPTDYADPFGSPWRWHDRPGLQERTWEEDAPQLAQPWDAERQAPTGYLVLNTTDAISNCKVLVSQVDLSPTDEGLYADGGEPTAPLCTGPDAELANAVDLQDYLGDGCMPAFSWATAAEFSARFPVVSPAGRISNETLPAACNEVADLQLVDGGLTDNSALGTIADLAPELVELIAESNAEADGGARPFVVPLVMYIQNNAGEDVTVEPGASRPDLLIPLAALTDAPLALITPGAWLTRLSTTLENVCPPGEAFDDCSAAVAGVRRVVPQGIAVVAPTTSPAVSVPLGWTLSSFSRTRLRIEAETQAECGKAEPDPTYTCELRGSYGELGDVLDLFEGDKPNR